MLLYEINLTFYPKIQKNKKNKKVFGIELDAPRPALNVETSNSFKPIPKPVITLYKSPVIPKKKSPGTMPLQGARKVAAVKQLICKMRNFANGPRIACKSSCACKQILSVKKEWVFARQRWASQIVLARP